MSDAIRLGWPQLIYLGLVIYGIGIASARYGRPKRDSYDIADVLISPAIGLAILYWGGFFG